jgi:cyclopropane fatty-acyl-phospholipid synthase-like methyltransferase
MMAFSESCERNKQPILDILMVELSGCLTALEVGSGSGQHAVHFASALPHVDWQPTDCAEELSSLAARITAEAPDNVRPPLPLDVRNSSWPGPVDAVFTANTLHIMSWDSVLHFFRGVGRVLGDRGLLCVYGPFLYADGETVPSNIAFDQWLRARDAESGLRLFEAVNELAGEQTLALQADHQMPANNRLLVWRRI